MRARPLSPPAFFGRRAPRKDLCLNERMGASALLSL